MKFRKNFLPRGYLDLVCCTVVLLLIPYIFWFELYVVIPEYYKTGSWLYQVHFATGIFLSFNILTNLLGIMMIDTSIKGRRLPSELRPGWRLCPICETIAPPRSWHCEWCKTCILKRDHHCIFSGCCIGHWNSRYFLYFLIYVCIATGYSTYINSFFIWRFIDFENRMTWLKIIFPLLMIFIDTTSEQIYIFLYLITTLAFLFSGVLMYYHTVLMLAGQVAYERNYKKCYYDYGTKKNISMVLGKRWYLTWICPFVLSPLPHDGIYWEPREMAKVK